MAFFEVEFPTAISHKAMGGPGFSTVVNTGFSGVEQRNRNWVDSLGKWTISLITPNGVVRQDFSDLLQAFFMVCGGKADGFRFKDHLDFQAVNQPLVQVGANVYLAKTYTIAGRAYVKLITKPITSAIKDYKGNALPDTVSLAGGGTLDPTTGIVAGGTPGDLASFQFHYPVRFNTDQMQRQAEPSNVSGGQPVVGWNSLEIVEVRPPNF
jgi:uncharacterized protein (TIGR02217 family)